MHFFTSHSGQGALIHAQIDQIPSQRNEKKRESSSEKMKPDVDNVFCWLSYFGNQLYNNCMLISFQKRSKVRNNLLRFPLKLLFLHSYKTFSMEEEEERQFYKETTEI